MYSSQIIPVLLPFTKLREKLLSVGECKRHTSRHTVLSDVSPRSVYFQFNPNMSTDIPMDEGSIEMPEPIQFDPRHLEKADKSLNKCARVLLQNKTCLDPSRDNLRASYSLVFHQTFLQC